MQGLGGYGTQVVTTCDHAVTPLGEVVASAVFEVERNKQAGAWAGRLGGAVASVARGQTVGRSKRSEADASRS